MTSSDLYCATLSIAAVTYYSDGISHFNTKQSAPVPSRKTYGARRQILHRRLCGSSWCSEGQGFAHRTFRTLCTRLRMLLRPHFASLALRPAVESSPDRAPGSFDSGKGTSLVQSRPRDRLLFPSEPGCSSRS